MSYSAQWVKIEKYIELTGDTYDAVVSRRKTGKWLDGKESKLVDGRLWVNLAAVNEWVEKWQTSAPSQQALNSTREREPSLSE